MRSSRLKRDQLWAKVRDSLFETRLKSWECFDSRYFFNTFQPDNSRLAGARASDKEAAWEKTTEIAGRRSSIWMVP